MRKVYVGTFIFTPNPTELSISHATAIGIDASGKIEFIEREITAEKDIHDVAAEHGWTPKDSYAVVRPPTHVRSTNRSTSTGRKPVHSPPRLTTFFFPGLIDTHTHAPQYPNTGLFGSSTLLSWLQTYTFPLESSFSSPARARHVYPRVVRRALANGTTAAAYYATVHVESTNILADVCAKAGQRALIGRVCMDRMSPEDYRDEGAEDAVEKTKAVIKYCETLDPEGALIRPIITPRFAPSCSDGCLAALGALHKETGHFVQTHVSENMAEIALVAEMFPEAKHYVGVYADAGLLGSKTVLAHAVHLSPEEVAVVAAAEAGVAHCPVSNSALTSGACRVRDLWDQGLKVGLGTDVSGGYSMSILEVVRQTLLVSRHVALDVAKEKGDKVAEGYKLSVEEALYLATRGGAAVLGIGDRVGAFEVGMEFDAMLVCLGHVEEEEEEEEAHNVGVNGTGSKTEYAGDDGGQVTGGDDEYDPGPVDLFSWESWPDIVAKWVYNGDDRNVGAVWVKGRCVHQRSGILAGAL